MTEGTGQFGWLHDRTLDRALGAAWHDDAPNRALTDLAALPTRMAGSDGERKSAELLQEAFDRAGAGPASIEPFDLTAWQRGTTTLSLTAPIERAVEAIALPYSPADRVEAPLVDVGYGTPSEIDDRDVDGAVVLASTDTPQRKGRFVHRQESYGYAVDAGAVGFVFGNHIEGQLPPTGTLRAGRIGEIPGVGVSYETAEVLRRYASDAGSTGPHRNGIGGEATVELAVDANVGPGTAHNVVATLGPDTEAELLVLAHHDAHDVGEGALDNGCGVATLLAAVRILAAIEDDLCCRVRVVATSGEEVGLLGAETLAEELDLADLRAVVNVDGAGRFRDLRTLTHASASLADLVESLADALDQPISVQESPHPHSDHWPFLRDGVPTLQLHSHSGERGRGVTHTRADTRDKADERAVREHGMLAALLIRALTDRPVPRLDDETLQSAFRESGYETGMKTMGEWPDRWT